VEPVTKRLSLLVNSGFWMMDFGLSGYALYAPCHYM